MSTTTTTRASLPAALAAVLLCAAATGCDRPAGDRDATAAPTASATRDATTAPASLDPRTVDLDEAEWSFAAAGWEDAPVVVTLSGGVAETTLHGWAGALERDGDPLYPDLDADGDDDAVAGLAFSAGEPGARQWVMTGWFAWVNDGTTLVQVPYPLESAGDCADAPPELSEDPDGGLQIDQQRMPLLGTCADGATVRTTRTVVLATDDEGVTWPVQTTPVAAWGGDCPSVLGGGDGELDLLVAPGLADPASPERPAIAVPTAPSWLDGAVPGWRIVGFADPGADASFCGWTRT